MRPLRLPLLAVVAVLATLLSAGAASALPPGFTASPVFSGLVNPTSVRFSPDGSKIFVAEKRGVVKVFDGPNDTTATTVIDLQTETYDFWDRGLLGMAVDPGFPARPYLYLLYTRDALPGQAAPKWNDACPSPPGATDQGCVASGRLVRVPLDPSTGVASGPPTTLVNGWCQQFPSHSIGDLRFVGGQLYASAGDGASFSYADFGQTGNPCGDPTDQGGALRAQTSAGGDGSILRVNPDTGAATVAAHGFRNPFRISNRPGTNELWVGDVGWNTWEEVDRFDTATTNPNFGWPCYEGNGRQSGYDGLDKPLCEGLYAPGDTGVVKPAWTYSHGAAVGTCGSGGSSVSGVAFYPGGDFPDSYDGGLFVSDYSRNCIWFLPRGADGLPDGTRVTTFAQGGLGPVELELGPDGALYAPNLNGGSVTRITYRKPTAVATADATEGLAPLTVQFDGSGSTGVGLSYAWDLDGDGQYDDSTAVSPSFTYASNGVYSARLRVTDGDVVSVSAPITISVGHRPVPTIAAPTPATSWAANQTLAFSGSATDTEDGAVPASAMTWSLDVHHCPNGCHIHHVQQFEGVAAGTFVAPDHDYPSYLTLSLTVTDRDGLTGTTSVRLDPRTVQLTVDSDPAGLQLGLDDLGGPGPLTKTVIEGSSNSVSAPSPQNGLVLTGWSDGATGATRTVVAGADTRLVARFAAPAATGGAGPVPRGLPDIAKPPVVAGTIARTLRLKHGRTARRDGTLRWRVRCRAAVACPATLVLRTRGSHPQTLARRSLTLRAHTARTVSLRLTRAARARLRRRGSLRVAVVFTSRPAAAAHRRTTTLLTLRAPAAWSRR